MSDWTFTDRDHELFARELESFVPPEIFDAHAHWYRREDFHAATVPELIRSGPPLAGASAFDAFMAELLPGRRIEGVFFPFPHADLNVRGANRFLCDEVRGRPASRGQLLVTPQDAPEQIREIVRREGLAGLKCYHVYAAERPTFEAPIEAYLPESQVRVAHEAGLTITLHIVRARALADPANQETIRRYCTRYSNARLILAHAARGFNPHHTLEGVQALRGLDNVWFDTSAVTDSGAIEAIIRQWGHTRVLYGSDFPVSQMRGRCVAVGDGFIWLSESNTRLTAAYGEPRFALVGHESLRTLKIAAVALRLNDSQVEDVFCTNARRLFE